MSDYFCLQGARIVLSAFEGGGIPADRAERNRSMEPMMRAVRYTAESGGRTFAEVAAQLRTAADLFEAGTETPETACLPRTASAADQPAVLREIADHVRAAGPAGPLPEAVPTRAELLLRYPRLRQTLLVLLGPAGETAGKGAQDAPLAEALRGIVERPHPDCLWSLPGLAAECRQALVHFGTEEALDAFFRGEYASGPLGRRWTDFLPAVIVTVGEHMREHHPPQWRTTKGAALRSLWDTSQFSGAQDLLSAFRRTGIPAGHRERHEALEPMVRAVEYGNDSGLRTKQEVVGQLRTVAGLAEAHHGDLPEEAGPLPRTEPPERQPAALREIADHVEGRPPGVAGGRDVMPTGGELLQRFHRLVGMLELYFGQDGAVHEAFEAEDAPEDPSARQLLDEYIAQVHGNHGLCPWTFPALAGECQEALVVFQTQEALYRFLLVEQGLGGGYDDWVRWLELLIETTAAHLREHHPPLWPDEATT